MTVQKFSLRPDQETALDALASSPAAKDAMAKRAMETLAERKKLAGELTEREMAEAKTFPEQTAAIGAAVVAFRQAEIALAECRAKVGEAVAARSNAAYAYRTRRQEIEAALAETASPAIDQFIAEMHADNEASRRLNNTSRSFAANPVTRTQTQIVHTNSPSIAARREAADRAIEAAEALKLEPDQSGVAAKLDELRAGLPPIVDVTIEAGR